MKFIISTLLLCTQVHASPIRVFHENEIERAQIVKNIFVGTYQIPEELVGINQISNCDEIRGLGKLDVCLKKNGDLKVVSVHKGFVSESLKVFQGP